MTTTLTALQQQRRDTASNWTSNNPTLLDGEFGWETDTKKLKIGDGSTAWQSLDYLPIPDTNRLLPGNLTVGGNFTVNGTSTTIDTTTLTVEDINIEIGKVSTPSDTTADGGGITLKGATDKTINWVDSTDSWTFSEHLDLASGKVLKSAGTQFLSSTQYTGNSATATALATARTIGGVSFDGTANIDLPGVNSAGNQNTTGSAATLTTPRTIAGVSFDGSANISLNNNSITNGAGYIDGSSLNASNLSSGTVPDSRLPTTLPAISGANLTSLNASNLGSGTVPDARLPSSISSDITGNAATATALATARTIAGVSFDGTANISLNNNAITNGAGYITATLTNEEVQDIVGAMLTGNTETGITVTYQDSDGTIDFVVASQTDENFTTTLKNKLDGIEAGAKDDQTASDIKTLLNSSGLVNAQIDASAAIAGSKIDPDFGSQNVTTTGTLGSGDHTITGTKPKLVLNDSNNENDFHIQNDDGTFAIKDIDSDTGRLTIASNGQTAISGNCDFAAGIDVTGNITATGDLTITSSLPKISLTDSGDNPDYEITNTNGSLNFKDTTNDATRISIQSSATTIANNLDCGAGVDVTGNITVSGTVDGRDIATDGTKLDTIETNATADQTGTEIRALLAATSNTNILNDTLLAKLNGIEAGADVTDATNVNSAGAVMNSDTSTASMNFVIDEDNFSSNSATKVPTQQSVKAYVDANGGGGGISSLVQDTSPQLGGDLQSNGNNIDFADNDKAIFGTGSDLKIYHDGTNSIMYNATGEFKIRGNDVRLLNAAGNELYFAGFANSYSALYYDNSKKFETLSDGVKIDGILHWDSGNSGRAIELLDNQKIFLGDGTDLQIYHDGTHSYIKDAGTGGINLDTNNLYVRSADGNETLADFNENGAVNLYYDNDLAFSTQTDGISAYGREGNNANIYLFADEGDDTADQWRIRALASSSTLEIQNRNTNASYDTNLVCKGDGGVELYHDNSKKFNTTSAGVQLTGSLAFMSESTNISILDNGKAKFGNGDDLQIYHDGTSNTIIATNGALYLKGDASNVIGIQPRNGENSALFYPDGAVELYHDNSKKFETESTGCKIDGSLELTANLIMSDNDKIRIGNSQDLEIYHDGSNSYLKDITDYLFISGNNGVVIKTNSAGTEENQIRCINNGAVKLYYDNSLKLETGSTGVGITGECTPTANNTYNLGHPNYRWANVYTNDLNLSNEGGKNDVDGTWGSYTIQEGEDSLFLLNKRNGKKYKFNLTEVT